MTMNGKPKAARAAAAPAMTPLAVSDTTLKKLAEMFKMLSDPSRLKIVLALAQDSELHVSALCELLGTPGEPDKPASQPAVSHHLTLMRIVGLVGFDRNGKHNYYYLASDRLCELFEQFFADAGDSTQALQFEEFALTFAKRAEA